uniref:Uncharacterized protein n=1 Tax=Steinernema glaseri TaxID=37863 RepID=A0A1I8AAJ9_9BILA
MSNKSDFVQRDVLDVKVRLADLALLVPALQLPVDLPQIPEELPVQEWRGDYDAPGNHLPPSPREVLESAHDDLVDSGAFAHDPHVEFEVQEGVDGRRVHRVSEREVHHVDVLHLRIAVELREEGSEQGNLGVEDPAELDGLVARVDLRDQLPSPVRVVHLVKEVDEGQDGVFSIGRRKRAYEAQIHQRLAPPLLIAAQANAEEHELPDAAERPVDLPVLGMPSLEAAFAVLYEREDVGGVGPRRQVDDDVDVEDALMEFFGHGAPYSPDVEAVLYVVLVQVAVDLCDEVNANGVHEIWNAAK